MKGKRSRQFMWFAIAVLMAGMATSALAGGRGEGGGVPPGSIAGDPSIYGKMVGTYVLAGVGDCTSNNTNGCLEFSFHGRCPISPDKTVTFKISSWFPLPYPPVSSDPALPTFAAIDMEGTVLPAAGPAGCTSAAGGEDVIIWSVTNWHDTFDVQMLNGKGFGHVAADLHLKTLIPEVAPMLPPITPVP